MAYVVEKEKKWGKLDVGYGSSKLFGLTPLPSTRA